MSENERAFLDKFREMLDDTQKAMFDEWIATGKRPC